MYRKFLVLFCGVMLLAVASNTFAGGGLWLGAGKPDQLWDTAANWENGVPALGETAFVTFAGSGATEGPIIQSGINAEVGTIILGYDAFTTNPGDTTTMNMTGGALTSSGDFWLGKDDGNDGNEGPGIFDLSGGIASVAGHLIVGQGSAGVINQTDGSMTAFRLVLDWDSNSPGTYNLHGGTLEVTDPPAPIHFRPGALMDITEGTMLLTGDHTPTIDGIVTAGQLTAFGGSGTILYDYDVTNLGQTTVWAVIPEPTSAMLFGIAGLLWMVRRRR